MARVMICDDDHEMAGELAAALRAANHDVVTCNHTMDALREVARGRFDLIAFGLDNAGFCGARAIEVVAEVAPHASVIGLHTRPSEYVSTAVDSRVSAILPRPVSVATFMYAVARALEGQHPRNSSWASTS